MRDFTILRRTRDEEPEQDYAVLGVLALISIDMIPAARAQRELIVTTTAL